MDRARDIPNVILRNLRALSRDLRKQSSCKRGSGKNPNAFLYAVSRKLFLLQLENSLHAQPLFTGFRLRKRLLKFPHQLFPLLHLWVLLVCFRLLLKREALIHFHDHEHPRPEQINFHVLDTGAANALRNLGPNFLVIAPVFSNQRRVIFQIERETESAVHATFRGRAHSYVNARSRCT